MLSYATIATRYVLIVEFIMLVAAWMCGLGDHLSSTIVAFVVTLFMCLSVRQTTHGEEIVPRSGLCIPKIE